MASPIQPLVQLILVATLAAVSTVAAANFNQDVQMYFGNGRGKLMDGGNTVALTLDKESGSGFQSTKEYLFGRFDMQLKLISDNSAGTVTTFYLSSLGDKHDEIDFEFLGNVSGEPYTVHTNVYAEGKGGKEQQFRLWFDPTAAFHTYSVVWNSQRIIFLVDNIPIRVHRNRESMGVPFPKSQPMRVYCSLWNADDWATQGGLVKTDWAKAPFSVYYRNFRVNACSVSGGRTLCDSTASTDVINGDQAWQTQDINARERNRLRWVQSKHMIYNYCTDSKRFPSGFPAECKSSRFL
ncbi:unnamed protein product [Cuscuta epithymum]|uniref:Xyloglucan endotransglucosylase/hydrolase n=1 Tax=Cuscuta epithymum TaxID=186058 RepID=A0AAV0DXW2_9ASTE|nr:unnamed protein product [Cuscuta epithymum]